MKRLRDWIKRFPVKKALTAIYVGAWIGGFGLIFVGAFLLGFENEGHLNVAVSIIAAVAVGVTVFKSWEEYQRAQREELRREIKEAVRRGILESNYTHTHGPQE